MRRRGFTVLPRSCVAVCILLIFRIAGMPFDASAQGQGESCGCGGSGLVSLEVDPVVVGGGVTIRISGPPNARFSLVGSRRRGLTQTQYGPLCLASDGGARLRILVDSIRGTVRPSLVLDSFGRFQATAPVGDRDVLLGRRFTLQAAVEVQGSPELTNAQTVVAGRRGGHVEVAASDTPRTQAAAGLLLDGRVLLTGGGTADAIRFAIDATARAELFDPSCNEVFPAGDMNSPRALHTFILLANGRVLIVGGVSSEFQVLRSAEEFDPETETFVPVGSMFNSRFGHSATLLNDGSVLILGGSSSIDELGSAFASALNTAELYDPVLKSFAPVPALLTEARSGHVAVLLDDGRVVVIGGAKDVSPVGRPVLATRAELYDPMSRTFSDAGDHRLNRTIHSAVKLVSGEVLVVGGLTMGLAATEKCELFDPVTKSFRYTREDLPVPKAIPRLVLLDDGSVLETGGLESFLATMGIAEASVYDPKTESFCSTGSLMSARAGHVLVRLADGRVITAGGATGTATDVLSIERYDP